MGGQGNFYKVDSVPRILNHLNQQRERFRDNFKICFIFIVRLFGLKYFIQRAPDFMTGALENLNLVKKILHLQ
jgi:superkiller protein 3